MPWLVNIVDRQDPERRPGSAVEARKETLLDLWSRHIAPVTGHGEGDYEDFYEQAVRLESALQSFGAGKIWLTVSQHQDGEARNLGSGEWRPISELTHLPRYGAQASRRHQGVDQPQALLADAYYTYEAFLARAGRRIVVCGFAPTDQNANDLGDILAGFAADGIRRAFVKVNLNKYAAFPVDLPAGFTASDAGTAMFNALDFGAMYLEGGSTNLQAQEYIAMQYEYRVFVVGQRAVTGAGCIEEFTPLDNGGQAFDTQVRRSRTDSSPVVDQPGVTCALVDFAGNAIKALAAEVPKLTDYVIDVALGPDGEPLIVELNPLLNSGLYASQPVRVTEAMAAREGAPVG